jgi:hypothetical protein
VGRVAVRGKLVDFHLRERVWALEVMVEGLGKVRRHRSWGQGGVL